MMKKNSSTNVDLVLAFAPFDDIKSGKKINEYRLLKPKYKSTITNKSEGHIKTVTLRRGYVKAHQYYDEIVLPWPGYTILDSKELSEELGSKGYSVYSDEDIEEFPHTICIDVRH
jgi:hypothetical protein